MICLGAMVLSTALVSAAPVPPPVSPSARRTVEMASSLRATADELHETAQGRYMRTANLLSMIAWRAGQIEQAARRNDLPAARRRLNEIVHVVVEMRPLVQNVASESKEHADLIKRKLGAAIHPLGRELAGSRWTDVSLVLVFNRLTPEELDVRRFDTFLPAESTPGQFVADLPPEDGEDSAGDRRR
jgi:hypothetical protein